MDARTAAKWIFAIVVVLGAGGVSCPVYAGLRHIYSGDFNLPIPANPDDTKGWMADAVINIPDHITISDLDVCISITHTSVFDLQIYLEHPAGTKLCLNMYHFTEFFKGEDYKETIFDDEAEIPIEEGEPPFTGRFRPRAIDPYNLLEVFDGRDAYGSWRLQIYDAFYHDTGTLNNFELMITTPEPTTAILLGFAAALFALSRPNRSS